MCNELLEFARKAKKKWTERGDGEMGEAERERGGWVI